jgi:hypothetical protein
MGRTGVRKLELLKIPQDRWNRVDGPTGDRHDKNNGHKERDSSQDPSDRQIRAWLAEGLRMQQAYCSFSQCQ